MRTIRWIAVTALVVLAAVIVPERAAAQAINFTAGPSLANISTDDPDFEGLDAKVGFFGAVGASFPLGRSAFVSPYVGYVQKGAKYSDGAKLSYDYIEIPLLLGLRFPLGESGVSGSLFAGPQVGFQVRCDEDGFDCKDADGRKSTELGVAGGVGLQLPVGDKGALSASVGADIGLTDLFDVGGASFKTRNYFLAIGYSVIIGR